ncbi:MAG: FAD-dependent oxidoreductase [Pseudomonadota bacterium]
MSRTRALVIGSGIQGACSALALANTGFDVVVLEQDTIPYNRTSLCGEGKVHLGFVYANDPTYETQRVMLDSALKFSSSIEQFIGEPVEWDKMRSKKFQYLILKDSMVKPEILLDRYTQLQHDYERLIAKDSSLNYIGLRPDLLWSKTDASPCIAKDQFTECLQTEEVAIYPKALRTLLVNALNEHSSIRMICNARVDRVRRTNSGFSVEAGRHIHSADIVVNCSWGDRLRIDEDLLPSAAQPCTFRLKY